MIKCLSKMKEKIGGEAEVPFMISWSGENDYAIPDYPVICDISDQNGTEYKCAFICGEGGTELGEKEKPFYEWKPWKNELKID